MQSPSDPDAHAHPHMHPHAHAHDHADPHGHARPSSAAIVQPSVPASAVIQPPASAFPASGPASLFLAGSRDRLLAASGVVALLWLLVWWALD